MRTAREVKTVEKSGMEYLHYPLKEKLVETLDRYTVQLVTDLDTLELSFNVDGLPLFKSSGKSMWPVLCAVMLSPVTIFPTALTCGTKKPTDLAFMEDTVTDLTEVLANGLDYRKKNIKVQEISSRLLQLKSSIPSIFARTPRGLDELERWKATEFRQFLLYTGRLVLKGVLREDLYNHFLTFSVAIAADNGGPSTPIGIQPSDLNTEIKLIHETLRVLIQKLEVVTENQNQHFSLHGKRGKKTFHNTTVYFVIKRAIMVCHAGSGEKFVEDLITNVLKHAPAHSKLQRPN
ncbi:hypothetical protein DPEC_G00146620 [Dallia pectoralis]|uniref:Uncharacterized protein n=1 Tax=Dallia pectoralis TaxID=75939 RepID=A0ACC2GPU7_DALPE|nr:hypothetical protein DPEC_G00146620 [Dallia pectoralis]